MISLENNRNFRCAVKPNKKSTCFFDWSIVGRACFCLLKSSETYPDATNVWVIYLLVTKMGHMNKGEMAWYIVPTLEHLGTFEGTDGNTFLLFCC